MSTDELELEVSLQRAQRTVKMELEPGVKKNYTLREMDGLQRDKYMNGSKAKTKDIGNGKVQVANFEGMYSLLLSYCLYDDEGKLVPEKTIQGYPTTAQIALEKAAKELNKLNRMGTEAAMATIGMALEEYKDDPAVALSIIRDVHQNWLKQVPGAQGEGGEGES